MKGVKNIPYQDNIYSLFHAALIRDKEQFIQNWMVKWGYQEKRERRKVKYHEDYDQDFHVYNGPNDIVHWFNWLCSQPKPDYFCEEQIGELVEKSRKFDEDIASVYHLSINWQDYDKFIGRNNAQDYILANLYPHPADSSAPCILDFGAGYGRQANLWTQMQPRLRYIGMDAIPKAYCLQHLYYAQSGKLVYDYMVNGPEHDLDFNTPGVYHLPTWRADLIPDNSIDKILAIQVLQEMNGRLVKEMIHTFHRILKPSGALFIRDSDISWRPAHKLNLNTQLKRAGFTLEYRAYIEDKKDLLGIPRIWRKTNPTILKQQHVSLKQRLNEAKIDIDALTRGRIKRAIKSIFTASKQ